METYLIGVDTSKHNFQVCGVTRDGRKTFARKVNRSQVIRVLTGYPGAKVALEVGSGAHFLGRTLKGLGHEVLLIPVFFVKPYLKSQKNDRNDAEAIAEAALRPGMRFVPVKAEAQQDIQNLHRVRERLIGNRTAVVNQIRGLLAEYGVVIPGRGHKAPKRAP
jgi:transposase